MVYHHPSVTGTMLWLRYEGIFRGKSLRQSVFDHLESPGTKTYTGPEALALFGDFKNVQTRLVFSPGDLLLHQPSARFQSGFYKLVWRLFPRWLVRTFLQQWGLFLLIWPIEPPSLSWNRASQSGADLLKFTPPLQHIQRPGTRHDTFPRRKSFHGFNLPALQKKAKRPVADPLCPQHRLNLRSKLLPHPMFERRVNPRLGRCRISSGSDRASASTRSPFGVAPIFAALGIPITVLASW